MKRDVGVDVMLCVVGHVPSQKADYPVGKSGSSVLQHISDVRTATVLRQQIAPHERVAEQKRENPDPEQEGALQPN